MKFSVGYFAQDEYDRTFAQALPTYGDAVAEVYFPWPGIRTCRSELRGEEAQAQLLNGLRAASRKNMNLNLLLNANCYGGDALSETLHRQIETAMDTITAAAGRISSVTTTSLFAAHAVRKMDPSIHIRASVNMRLKTWAQMCQLLDLFDGFYLAREMNYELSAIAVLKKRLQEAGKSLHLLANSGCTADCPGQIFHDNLVAHEEEIAACSNETDFNPYVCWRFYEKKGNHHRLLSNTWIRPEDLHHYEALFPVVKLATRIHSHPSRVISAYSKGRYAGNILDLMEPSHASVLYPAMLRNDLFPDEWFERRKTCHRNCELCSYCASVFEKIKQ